MAIATLGEFISHLEKNGELSRIKTKVSAKLEIAQVRTIQHMVSKLDMHQLVRALLVRLAPFCL